MNIQAIREFMPWELQVWAEAIGLDIISRDTILSALERAQTEYAGEDLSGYRVAELRELGKLYGGTQFRPVLARAEAAIKVGTATKVGREIAAARSGGMSQSNRY